MRLLNKDILESDPDADDSERQKAGAETKDPENYENVEDLLDPGTGEVSNENLQFATTQTRPMT